MSNETFLTVDDSNYGGFTGGRVLCSDGTVRALKTIERYANTFFSVHASVKVKGKTVSGWVSSDDYDRIVFRANKYGKNADLLPPVLKERSSFL